MKKYLLYLMLALLMPLLPLQGQGLEGTKRIIMDDNRLMTTNFDTGSPMIIDADVSDFIDNTDYSAYYFFSKRFDYRTFPSGSTELRFGGYKEDAVISGLTASQEEFQGKIKLSWDAVPNAYGYLIFRDIDVTAEEISAYAVIEQTLVTTFTDSNVGIGEAHTYYVMAFNASREDEGYFAGNVSKVEGKTRAFNFEASTDNEVRIDFNWDFDNHVLLDLPNQAVYFTIHDDLTGELVYEEQLSLTDVATDALLWDRALKVSGDENDGVYLDPLVGNLSSWTIETWLKKDKDLSGMLWSHNNIDLWADDDNQLYINDKKLNLSLEDDVWAHVALTYTEGTNAFQLYINGKSRYTETISGMAITPAQRPRFLQSKDKAYPNFNGYMAMVRIWAIVRTPKQIRDDFGDLYTESLPGLEGQWTFNENTIRPISSVSGRKLSIGTSGAFSVDWVPSTDFINPVVQLSRQHWLDEPTDEMRSFTISMYEAGSGYFITSIQDNVKMLYPGTPIVQRSDVSGNLDSVRVRIVPTSKMADKYVLSRTDSDGKAITLARLGIGELSYWDTYDYHKARSIQGGQEYTYSVLPYYSVIDYYDSLAIAKSRKARIFDIDVKTTALEDRVQLDWNHDALKEAGYESVRIERNGEVQKELYLNFGRFYDSLILYGVDYEYNVIARKGGKDLFAQKSTAGLKSNGRLKAKLITKKGDEIVGEKKIEALRTIGRAIDTVRFYANEFGEISADALFYGREATFKWLGKAEGEFHLSRSEPSAQEVWVTYDTTYHKEKSENTLLLSINSDAADNKVTFDWQTDESTARVPIYTNIYRRDETGEDRLLDIIRNSTVYTDHSGKAGNAQVYTFKSYFRGADGKTLYWSETDPLNVDFPLIQKPSAFSVSKTDDDIAQIQWTYPSDAKVTAFIVERHNEAGQYKRLKTLSQNTSEDDVYKVYDALAYPGKAYTYRLSIINRANDTIRYDHPVAFDYPLTPVSDIITQLERKNDITAEDKKVGKAYAAKVDGDRVNWRSWDGVYFSSESGNGIKDFSAFEKSRGIDNLYHYFNPLFKAKETGQYAAGYYKHTDEGLFLSPEIKRNDTRTIALSESVGVTSVGKSAIALSYPEALIGKLDSVVVTAGPGNRFVDTDFFDREVWFVQQGTAANLPVRVKAYAHGIQVGSTKAIALKNHIDATTDGVPLPTAFQATKDVFGKVYLSWEYLNYTEATFKIYKNGTSEDKIIGELENGERSFIDAAARPLEINHYLIKAFYRDREGLIKTSAFAYDWGVARQYITVEGKATFAGDIPAVGNYIGVKGTSIWTKTDSTGYFELGNLELPQGSNALMLYNPYYSGKQEYAFEVTGQQQRYTVDATVSGIANDLRKGDSNLSDIFAFTAYADTIAMGNTLHWQATDGYHKGFILLKGAKEIARVPQGASMSYSDPLTDLSTAGYSYSVAAYYEDASGNEHINATASTSVALDYPNLEEPKVAHAYASPAQGVVELSWAHRRANVTGFIIERNDTEIGRVNVSEEWTMIDSTGIPGDTYRYNIYSYLERGGQTVRSLRSALVEATYPETGFVTAVMAKVGRLDKGTPENYVEVSWDYPTSVKVDGAILYRSRTLGQGGWDSLAVVSYPDTLLIDYKGTPEAFTTYHVRAFANKGGKVSLSKRKGTDIIYPKLQEPLNFKVEEINMDTVKVTWDYEASNLTGFELSIMDKGNRTVVMDTIPFEGRHYEYLFRDGLSGMDYSYTLRAMAIRGEETYYSLPLQLKNRSHPLLPEPAFLPTSYTKLDQYAVFRWTYPTAKHDGFRLTLLDANGVPYKGSQIDKNGEVIEITYADILLPPGQREYKFLADLKDLYGDDPKSFTFQLTAFQQEVEATPVMGEKELSMFVGDKNKYPQRITASQNLANSIVVNWAAPTTAATLKKYILYRDGKVLINIPKGNSSYEDRNIDKGVGYVYQLAAVYPDGNDTDTEEDELPVSVRGRSIGDGSISSQVLSLSGDPIEGDSLMITATINGEGFSDRAVTNAKGQAIFTRLAYDSQGIEYTVQPLGTAGDYREAVQTAVLSNSIQQFGTDAFIHTKMRLIKGEIDNVNYVGGYARDSVEVRWFSIEGSERNMQKKTKTDHRGVFSIAIPYTMDLNAIDGFELEVDNRMSSNNNRDLDSLSYRYELGENMRSIKDALGRDSLLIKTYTKEMLTSEAIHYTQVHDTIRHPLEIKVTGPGKCSVMEGYEFLLRVKNDNKRLDTLVWTGNTGENGSLLLNLPPLKFTISMVDVNKRDAFSQSVIDYFRSRELTVDNNMAYRNRLSGEGNTASTVTYLRYNERTDIAIEGLAGILEQLCDGKELYVLDAEQGSGTQQVTLNLLPEQTINSTSCAVTSGYIIPKFPGGTFGTGEDTLTYRNNAWEKLTITATTPNMATPYTQLLELYYYDQSGNFQGIATEEILVTGLQRVPGKDVFVVPENSNEVLVPLYVLRDPPGDKSSSFIKQSSLMSYQFNKLNSLEKKQGFVTKFNFRIFGLGVNTELEQEFSQKQEDFSFQNLSLEFKESINTVKNPIVSENLEGYLDGPDADIIVGASFIMSYGIMERLSLEQGCSIRKSKSLEVDPEKIKTTWAYTRSQIKNTVQYYNSLVKKEGDDYTNQEGTVFSGSGSNSLTPEDIAQNIGVAKEMFQNILDVVDQEFTPACEMCRYIKSINPEDYEFEGLDTGTDSGLLNILRTISNAINDSKFDYFVRSYYDEVNSFCDNQLLEANNCKPLAQAVANWNNDEREAYNQAYKKYAVLKEMIAFYNEFSTTSGTIFRTDDEAKEIQDVLLDRINEKRLFEPLENLTFSTGTAVSRVFEKTVSGLESSSFAFKSTTKIEFGLGGKKNDSKIGFFFGLGAGTLGEDNFVSYSFLPTLKFAFEDKSEIGADEFEMREFKTGFSLDDNDDGDHFSTDIYMPFTDGQTKTGPYFNVIGGRSSCPYETGTVPRDLPKIQLLDSDGNLLPDKLYDLNPDDRIAIPVSISSGNIFNEGRLVQITAPLNTNKRGLIMEIEGVKINNYRGSVSFVEAGAESYRTQLNIRRDGLPDFDFEDIELVAKPNCFGGKGTYWEDEAIYDTLRLELHYRKPISPVRLETDIASWFLIDDVDNSDDRNTESMIFNINDLDVEQHLHSLKEVFLEYKKENATVWTRMKDNTTGEEVLPVEMLLDYYEQNRNSYPEPLYPFSWDISKRPDISDGQYQVRATVVHENGSTAYSNVLAGTIDRTRPTVVGQPSPSDGILARGESIAISFSETMDCETVMDFSSGNDSFVKVSYMNGAGTFEDLAYLPGIAELSDYSYTCTGSGVDILIDDARLEALDGQLVMVTLTGMTDYLGNVSDPNPVTWSFVVDYFKQTTSPITLLSPEDWLINETSLGVSNKMKFVITDYDVSTASYNLEYVTLETRRETATAWEQVDSLNIKDLQENYRAMGNAGLTPMDTLYWSVPLTVPDGSYQVRAIAVGDNGRKTISNGLSGRIDRTAPRMTGVQAPDDGILDKGETAAISFTESMDCNGWNSAQATLRMTPFGASASSAIAAEDVEVHCAGSEVVFTFNEAVFKAHTGAAIDISIEGMTDRAGNVPKAAIAHRFILGDLGNSTSSVELTSGEEPWIVNSEAAEASFTLSDFDLYSPESVLDSIVVEYSIAGEANWKTVEVLPTATLAAYHSDHGKDEGLAPTYPVTWKPRAGILETDYQVRAIAFGGKYRPRYSAILEGRIDRTAPYFTGKASPDGGILRYGEEVSLTFTEALLESSVNPTTVILEQKLVSIDELGDETTEWVPVASEMYFAQADGHAAAIFFDESFTQNFEDEILRVTVGNLRDRSRNPLEKPVVQEFKVENVMMDNGVSFKLPGLDFKGRLESDGAVALAWNNTKNGKIQHYIVERSTDGKQFEEAGTVAVFKADSYDYLDFFSFGALAYYRLSEVDLLGERNRSKIVIIRRSVPKDLFRIMVSPNPIQDRKLNFHAISADRDSELTVRVLDRAGVKVYEAHHAAADFDGDRQSILLDTGLEVGIYLLQIIQDEEVRSVKFAID